ncbi:uncharacterized protein LOC132545482 [Ylistrum balloti]|uniref:uncharacterized protein LOC132545482 n=1 Tax=Ylistrum balloti TaxID=509963 RepID=UPI002905E174|nr:uncharacterized protein LOC132545482 [Ylistrum balloti]
MRIPLNVIVIYITFNWIRHSDGACTFPDEISGVWYSADKGPLTFNSTMIVNYPIFMSYSVNSLDFVCEENDGYKYLLKSTTTTLVFGSYIYGYLCIELRRVSPYKYYYYIGTTVEQTVNEHIYGRVAAITVTMTDACNRAEPYEDNTFVMLVKDGAPYSTLGEASCTGLLANYGSITVKDYTGTTSCSGSSVVGCTDRTRLQFTYASCATSMVFSGAGLFMCMRAVTYGDYIYLALWNNDTTVDDSSTFRFTCMAIANDGSNAYLTEYPRYCKETSQTSVSVATPGIIMELSSQSETCESIVDGATYLMFIVIMITIGPLIILGLVVLTYCCCKKGCPCSKKSRWCGKKGDSGSRPSTSYSQRTDTVNNTIFKLNSLPPLRVKYKRPFGPIVEANMIQPLPKVESLYSNAKGDRLMSSKSRKGSLGSLFSFSYKN